MNEVISNKQSLNRTGLAVKSVVKKLTLSVRRHTGLGSMSALRKSATAAIGEALYGMTLPYNDNSYALIVKEVIVIVSSSRSGSSLVFDALANGKGVIAPLGEHEPWLFLTKNKYPFVASDAISSMKNKSLLLNLIRNDLVSRRGKSSPRDIKIITKNRNLIRRFSGDGDSLWPIENSPYVDINFSHIATDEELSNSTVVFKSPSDSYREPYFEDLFPNANVRYVYLTRGFAQTVNGLWDGWSGRGADFASQPVGDLAIKGYEKGSLTDGYWCFDLFPSWKTHKKDGLLNVCLHQWINAHEHIKRNYSKVELHSVKFEMLYSDRDKFIDELSEASGVDVSKYNWSKHIMRTDKPTAYRWKKRGDELMNIEKYISPKDYCRLIDTQHNLGYDMKWTSWL